MGDRFLAHGLHLLLESHYLGVLDGNVVVLVVHFLDDAMELRLLPLDVNVVGFEILALVLLYHFFEVAINRASVLLQEILGLCEL